MLTTGARFLTTHSGSLPRPAELAELHGLRSKAQSVDAEVLNDAVAQATDAAIAMQIDCGIDVGNDGEQARESFLTYVQHRMTGFGQTSDRPLMRDLIDHPDYIELALPKFARIKVDLLKAPSCVADVTYGETAEVAAECDLVTGAGFAETFMTAASPGIVCAAMRNEHYPTMPEYMSAVATALAVEYRYIVHHGFLLQVDAPDLAMERHVLFGDKPLGDFLEWVELAVASINQALAGIDRNSVRLHVCWGNYEGPHDHDVGLEEILPIIYQAEVGAIVCSMANPRHAHEHRLFEKYPLPDQMALVVGVIDTTSNYIEHPEVVADRIENAARSVGDPTRIIAGTDCGFDTSAGLGEVAPSVVRDKLRSLRAGADIASERLL
jgi:5-methyltetrahydropteroyltriglutamate--homocysteine methyltransferase